MKKTILSLSIGLLLNTPAFAQSNCFLATENHQVLKQEGDCKTQHSPRCSFNIALSLMAFEEGLLTDTTHPKEPFNKNYADGRAVCEQVIDPKLWIKNSCVWYSQWITQELGMRNFEKYVSQFNYGNQDLTGQSGQNNGLTRAWLNSSLRISGKEHVAFLQKFVDHQLGVSAKSYEMTKRILFVEDLPNGWKLYGKTGTGTPPDADGMRAGWFAGWIEKDNRTIVFAHYIESDNTEISAGPKAKEMAKEKLMQLVEK